MGVQQHWSTTPSANATSDTAVNLQENQAPSTLNDAARAVMAQVRKTVGDFAGSLVTTGSATAFAVTSNEVITALSDGLMVRARAHTASGANPTFALDGTAAKAIKLAVGIDPHVGAIVSGGVYTFTYYAATEHWIVSGGPIVSKFVGETFEYAGTGTPPWSLLCYGQAVSRTTYAALFAAIGTQYGSGNGSTTFNLPDDRGRVIAGKDDMGGTSANRLTNQSGGLNGDTLGATGGAETHTLTTVQIEAHTHSFSGTTSNANVAHDHSIGIASVAAGGGATGFGSGSTTVTLTSGDAHTHTFSGTTGGAGSGAAHNNVQPTIIRNKYIFAGA